MTETDALTALANQWDAEAQSARDEAAGLSEIADNVERHRALRNLARTSAHHAEQLRKAMAR